MSRRRSGSLVSEAISVPPSARALGEAYLAEGRALEALAFLAKAGAQESLEQIRVQAEEAGDVFLLREAASALGREIDAASWRRVAEAARRLGKDRYAAEASRQAARFEQ